jgi:dTMP kinase
MQAPRFITLEGGEGAGKSTQLKLLAASFTAASIAVKTTREPGGSEGAEAIRNLVVSGGVDRWNDTTEALLFMTARYDHVQKLIKPALAAGEWVISDRFYDSTYVYQGMVKGVGGPWLDTLYAHLFGNFMPDATLLLDLPAETGLKRASARGNEAESRFERMGLEFHTRLREAFLARATSQAARIITIDATQTPEFVHQSIVDVLNKRFNLGLKPSKLA